MRPGLLPAFACACAGLAAAADLPLPPLTEGPPAAGRRAAVTPPEYAGTQVHHLIALPDDWSPDWKARGKSWPVIAEYTGNRFEASGSTGEVEGAALGYGVSRGRAIWLVLPYVAADHRRNEVTWWGDVAATVAYAKTEVPRVCAEFGGDSRRVVLCGFSRGAIGVSFLGLHDDEVARLWCGFWAHDHFDGVKAWVAPWGAPLDRYRTEAATRLRRLGGRPLLISQGFPGEETRRFVEPLAGPNVRFLPIDMEALYGKFPNEAVRHAHNDRWPLRPGPGAEAAQAWFAEATNLPPAK
ncbi:hypothetical protein EBR16_01260 [bacterium]|jgi:hypothetical protein|nr:hypothetical protein [bacterium]